MQSTVSGVTTAFAGAYEWTSSGNTLYYSAGGARVAMRRSGYTSDNGLFWIMGDHLGSTSITANADGSLKSMLLYKAWGEVRYSTGVANTKYTFTGQYTHVPDFGLMFYVARWYDPALGRFAQADTMGAGDRYAYVNNNPVRFTDPTGHHCETSEECENDPEPEPTPEEEPYYDVDISDEFTADEKAEIMAAILAIAAKLGGWQNFNTIFRGTIFIRDTTIGGWGGIVKGDGVHLNPSLLTEYMVVHEMGHVFQGLVYAADYDNSPANQLVKGSNAIKNDAGEVISGYDPDSYKYIRTDQGYQPCSYEKACRYEEHPTTIDIAAGENPNNNYEDVADMFLNWVYDSFDYSSGAKGAGTARYNWWDSRMSGWIDTLQK